MLRVALLLSLVTVALSGHSPNLDVIDILKKSNLGSRYSTDVFEDSALDVPNLIRKYGYPAEVHSVVSEDGYIIEAHRIPHGRDNNNQPGNKIPVFLMHGLFCSSADWVILGPGSGLAYLLAEEGYDVWLGNARGNTYSRRHLTLDANSERNVDYWKFSWDEMGNRDIPAVVDYIVALTGQQRMHYIGHSQGTTTFLVMNSLKPQYNARFISFHGLAPAAYLVNAINPMYDIVAPYERIIVTLLDSRNIGGVMTDAAWVSWFINTFCSDDSILQPLCVNALFDADSNFNATIFPIIFGHTPAGSSIRQFAHFCQNYNDKKFQRYDHGVFVNMANYGRSTPPEYEVGRITVPVYLYHGLNDDQVDLQDVQLLHSNLGNSQGIHILERESFNHYDFIWGGDVKTLLYDTIINRLNSAN